VQRPLEKYKEENNKIILSYKKEIEKKLKAAQSQGDLDGVLQNKAILDSLKTDNFDAAAFFNDPKDISKQAVQRKLQANQNVLIKTLETIEKGFVKDGKIAEAKAVRDYCNRYRNDFSLPVIVRDFTAKAGTRIAFKLDGVEYAFRWCPAGTFIMGSPNSEAGRRDDETQHKVTLTKGF
jgi:hypothetical protein